MESIMLRSSILGILCSLFSSTLCAQSVVLYPLKGADAPPSTQPRQTTVLGSVPRAQPNPWYAFFEALRQCKTGRYTLPQLDPALIYQYGNAVVENIIGPEEKLCHVEVTLMTFNGTNPFKSDCKFSNETIELLIARYTNFINGAAPTYKTDENTYKANLQKECK
jgi:hypothetical protein